MPLLLVVAFVVVPLIELAIILQVGELIGAAWTIVALLGVSLAGAWLVRREGTRAWSRLRGALREGRMPTDEALAGAFVLVGGALLLTPGFATDALGLALVIPPTRALIASAVKTQVGRRVTVSVFGSPRPGGPRASRDGPHGRARGDGEIVDIEVVDVDRDRGHRDGARRDRPDPERGSNDRPRGEGTTDDDEPRRASG